MQSKLLNLGFASQPMTNRADVSTVFYVNLYTGFHNSFYVGSPTISITNGHKNAGVNTSTVIQVVEKNDLLTSIFEALQSLSEIAKLQNNWDGYGAISPTIETIENAERFVRRLNILQQDIYFVSPGPNGNILVELRKEQRTIGFHFYPDKPLRYTCFNGKDFVQQGEYTSSVIADLLHWLHTEIESNN